MTNDQYVALGRLLAAQSFMTRNVIGVLGHLVQNEPEVTAAFYPFIAPSDRVRLCIHLLEVDSQRHSVSAAAYQKLDSALRGVLDKMLVEFDIPVNLDIAGWLENNSDPWGSITLAVDAPDLERLAL